MACGILPVYSKVFGLRDLPLRDSQLPLMEQLGPAFQSLSLQDSTVSALQKSLTVTHQDGSQALPAFADLLGLYTYKMALPDLNIYALESPFPIPVVPMGSRPESRVVWRWILQSQLNAHVAPKSGVLEAYDRWVRFDTQHSSSFFEDTGPRRTYGSTSPLSFFLDEAYNGTSIYFDGLHPEFHSSLIRWHININAHSF